MTLYAKCQIKWLNRTNDKNLDVDDFNINMYKDKKIRSIKFRQKLDLHSKTK